MEWYSRYGNTFYLIEYNTVLSHDTPEKIENSRVYIYDSQLFIEATNIPIATVALYDLTGKKYFFIRQKLPQNLLMFLL